MTLDEFRESLNRENWTILATDNEEPETALSMGHKIEDGNARYPVFMVSTGVRVVYEGQNFSAATRRYWEIAFGDKR